jgi:hypothetical protein
MNQETWTLQDALFAVEERPVGVGLRVGAGAEQVFQLQDRHKAIVDSTSGRVFAIVTRDYRLITNAEAIDLGRECFTRVFGADTGERMEFFNLVRSKSGSFCHIDFTVARTSPAREPEWLAFLRVTNSYNRMRSLQFAVGLCRGICRNGVIFGKRSIEFRAPHVRREVERAMNFHLNFSSMEELRAEFEGWLGVLRRTKVAPEDLFPLTVDALALPLEARNWRGTGARARFAEAVEAVERVGARYRSELGDNAYAAFNLITDLASRPPKGLGSAASVDRLQRHAADWAERFSVEAASGDFVLENHLAPYVERIASLSQHLRRSS